MTSKRKTTKKRAKAHRRKKEKGRVAKKAPTKPSFDLREHILVPHQELVKEEERAKLISEYGPLELFPKMLVSDPVASQLGAKPGDVVKVIRPGEEAPTYRLVVEG